MKCRGGQRQQRASRLCVHRPILVHQISGVEYVYSTSAPSQSLVIVRFLVGTPQEDALIKVYSKLYSNWIICRPEFRSL